MAKREILDAATRLMRTRGYSRTTLGDILRESGAAKGNFYHHFRSKEDLGYAIVDRLGQDLVERTLDPIFSDPARAPLEKVDALLEAMVAAQRARKCVGGCPMGNLATELSDLHEGFRERLAGIFERWRQQVAGALREAQAAGTLVPEADPDTLGRFLVAGLEGAILLSKVQKDIAVMETCVRQLRQHLALHASRPRHAVVEPPGEGR